MTVPEPSPPENPAKRSWSTPFFVAVGCGLLAFLVFHFGWRELYARLTEVRPLPFAVMIALIIAGFWVRAWKWHLALGPGQRGVGLFFLAKMGGNWSPGRIGEFSPLLLRAHRTPRIAAWILADRVVEVLFTLLLGVVGLGAVGAMSSTAAMGTATLLAAACAVAATALARARHFERWAARWPHGSLRGRIARLTAAMHQELRALGARTPVVLALTALGKLTDLYAVVALCAAFGYSASFLLVCAARCAHALVSAVPATPDATGVPYLAAAYLLHTHAGIPLATLTVALAVEAALINLILALSFLAVLPRLKR